MTTPRKTTRQRLVQAALELFSIQGVTETTTRQIADRAEVNEVTLFRNFGSKHGLLLAVIQEAEALTQLGNRLGQQAEQAPTVEQALRAYAEGYLASVDNVRQLVRSLVGEAGQYPIENRQAIAAGLGQIHHFTEQYLATVLGRQGVVPPLPPAELASLLNTLLLGYALTDLDTETHGLWRSRQALIDAIVHLLPSDRPAERSSDRPGPLANAPAPELDLPGPLVRALLQTARKVGVQDYAIAYVLFGAGLSPQELVSLQRIHTVADSQQCVIYIPGSDRQVPLNQWILGHRYGSYAKNPLTQCLKTRKDSSPALFINDAGQPLSEMELRLRWQSLTADLLSPTGQPPSLTQAQPTWCVEMLMRGMEPQTLALLTGQSPEQLAPYRQRAQARLALDQALRLDQKPGKDPAAVD